MTARHLQRSAIRAASVCCLAVLLFAASGVDTVFAYWTWSSTTHMTVSVAQATSSFAFEAGKSKATGLHEGKPSAIASIDAETGRVTLDFGEVTPGNRNDSPEVLLLTNTSGWTSTLHAKLSANLLSLFSEVSLDPATVRPSGVSTLAMKLSGRATAGAHYAGTLTLTDDGGQLIATMIVRLRVVGEQRLDQPQDSSAVLPSDETSKTPDACAADDAPAATLPSVPLTTTPVPDPATESSAPPLPVSPLSFPDAPGLSGSDEATSGVDATLTPLPCGDATRTADAVCP